MIDVLITGCARSGTSLLAGCIDQCGASGGKLVGSSVYNKKGYFENMRLRQEVVKPSLELLGCDPLGQAVLPSTTQGLDMRVTELMEELIPEIIKSEFELDEVKYYKGAKLCLLWRYWNDMFPFAHWIIARRPTPDIMMACQRTSFMSRRTNWDTWVDAHLRRFNSMKEIMGDRVHFVSTPDLASGNTTQLKAVVDQINWLEWNEQGVMDFIDPSLYTGAVV